MNFVSFAQNYEDVMLWRALKHVEKGVYVDVGANDPVQDSLTKAFYDRGWSGINIEPVTEWYEKLRSDRLRDTNLRLAAGAHDGELLLFDVVDTGLSTTSQDYAQQSKNNGFEVREVAVPVQTLSNILTAQRVSEIHFLKIDVEGGEESVLQGLDLTVIRPWIILVEATRPQTNVPDYAKWEPLITDHDYQFVYFDGLNRFYVAAEHAELAEAFTVPPNHWDQYERAAEYSLRQQCSTYERENAALRAEAEALRAEAEALRAEAEALRAESRALRSGSETLKAEAEALRSEAEAFRSKAESLNPQLTSQEATIQSLRMSLDEILNSRTWRIASSLRFIGRIVRAVKQRLKAIILKLIALALARPKVKSTLIKILNRVPGLKHRLVLLTMVNEPELLHPVELPQLSARATQVLADLQQAIKR